MSRHRLRSPLAPHAQQQADAEGDADRFPGVAGDPVVPVELLADVVAHVLDVVAQVDEALRDALASLLDRGAQLGGVEVVLAEVAALVGRGFVGLYDVVAFCSDELA